MGYCYMEIGDGFKRVMFMIIWEFVDKFSEVEFCELFWEDMIELVICDK